MADTCKKIVPVFDPNDSNFFNPPNMPAAICEYTQTDLSIEEVLTSAYVSLACSYRHSLEKIQKLTGKIYKVIHIVGGGCKIKNSIRSLLTLQERL